MIDHASWISAFRLFEEADEGLHSALFLRVLFCLRGLLRSSGREELCQLGCQFRMKPVQSGFIGHQPLGRQRWVLLQHFLLSKSIATGPLMRDEVPQAIQQQCVQSIR
jgi:hypothetical protein